MPSVVDHFSSLLTMATALDGLDIAMCVFDPEDRTVLWNRAFLRFFPEHADHVYAGEPYSENLRRFYTVRLDANEIASIERYIDEGIERHRAQRRPYSFRHRGVWLRVSSLPLANGGRVRVWRRGGTPRLSETEESAALPRATGVAATTDVFEHVGDGVMLTDANNRITWVNEHFVSMFGLPEKAAAIGSDFEAVYRLACQGLADDERGDLETGLTTLSENLRYAGAPFELPLLGRRWIRVIEQRRRDGVGFFALIDITQLKRQQHDLIVAEQRARESEALLAQKSRVLEATLERMEQGVMMVNAQKMIEVCNRRAMELLDLPSELMASKPSFAQVVEYQWQTEEFAYTPEDLLEFVRSGANLEKPPYYERKRPNGRVIEVRNVPIEGGGFLRTYTDITERKRAEETRHLLESQLRQAQKLEAVGTLAGGIAHDFNNIVAAILGNVALAAEALDPTSSARGFLEQAAKAGHRARNLVQQILAFGHRQPTEFVTLALQPLVEETVAMLRTTVGSTIPVLTVVPGPAIGVRADPNQLQQVLMNLGINAWQALRDGQGYIQIGLEQIDVKPGESGGFPAGLAAGPHVRLWVRDNGSGMHEKTRERIFEPFFTTKPLGEGTGLGLAVVHGIVESHGGAIAVESAIGQGSTFSVYLPQVRLPDMPEAAQASQATPPRGRGQHVLYVDDDAIMAELVQALLVRLGYRAICMTDAANAVEFVEHDPEGVSLVITDFNMPGLTGLDVARALAKIRPDLPVVITSGYIPDELRASARETGVHHLMHKERTLEDLGDVVYAALNPVPR